MSEIYIFYLIFFWLWDGLSEFKSCVEEIPYLLAEGYVDSPLRHRVSGL